MVKEDKFGLMALFTKAIGRRERRVVGEDSSKLMENIIQEKGKMIKLMGLASLQTKRERNIQVNGSTISKTDTVKSYSLTAQSIRESTTMVSNMERDCSFGLTSPLTKGSSSIMK